VVRGHCRRCSFPRENQLHSEDRRANRPEDAEHQMLLPVFK